MRIALTSALAAACLSTTATGTDLVGHWEFDNSLDLGHATRGADMIPTGPIVATSGISGTDGAAEVPVDAYLTVPNSIGPNGAGTLHTNEYTLVLDIKIPTLANWIAIAEFDNLATADGDYFYSITRGLGVNSEGYVDDGDPPTSIVAGSWHRMVLAMDNGVVRETYVDGVRMLDPTASFGHRPGTPDGRWALRTTFDLFSDNGGGEEAIIHVSQVALYDGLLTGSEIVAMGDVNGAILTPAIGTSFCSANPNSTGLAGEITATGSDVASANNVTLTASNLPPGQFGIFVTSASTNAGATVGAGVLCLGGATGRYNGPGQILQANASGEFSLALDLTLTPLPSTVTSVMAGDTRSWQAWHRDFAGTSLTSNFTNGVTITF